MTTSRLLRSRAIKAYRKGGPWMFFLHDVLSIDQSGLALLTRLAAKSRRLLATGVYTSCLVRGVLAACDKTSAREARLIARHEIP